MNLQNINVRSVEEVETCALEELPIEVSEVWSPEKIILKKPLHVVPAEGIE